MTGAPEMTAQEVIADLLGSPDFPATVIDVLGAAALILERLRAHGFVVKKPPGFSFAFE
jgi:hypothetical protein